MTIRTLPDVIRPDISTVTPTTHEPPTSPWPGPELPGPSQRPVDPVLFAAELEVRLVHQGSPPGDHYRRAAFVDAIRLALAAADIPTTDDPLAESRRVVARVRALAGDAR